MAEHLVRVEVDVQVNIQVGSSWRQAVKGHVEVQVEVASRKSRVQAKVEIDIGSPKMVNQDQYRLFSHLYRQTGRVQSFKRKSTRSIPYSPDPFSTHVSLINVRVTGEGGHNSDLSGAMHCRSDEVQRSCALPLCFFPNA
jgi:hypothetical protein